jgi:hypothetical protein
MTNIRTTRHHRASEALTVIELDASPLPEIISLLARVEHVRQLRTIPPLP